MANQVSPPAVDALAQLHDIHLPTAIGWWPLAIGWYFLAVVLILFIGTAFFYIRRYYLTTRYRRQALSLLLIYEQTYQREQHPQVTAACVSELLKRVALIYFAREEVASLQGNEWLDFLSKTARGFDFNAVRYELLEAPYQPLATADLQGLFVVSRKWIQQRS